MPSPVITTRLRPFPLRFISRSGAGKAGTSALWSAPSSLRLLHPQSAVDEEYVARDERRLVGGQEAYRPRDLVRFRDAAERCVGDHRLRRLLGQHLGEPGLHVPRGDDVRAHAARTELTRKRLRET